MSYTLYHGCIKSAVEPITHGEYGLEHGNNKITHPWSCADGDTIFFYDATLMKKSECIYDDDNETAIQYYIERCNEQAQIQNACLPHPFDVTCVLEITFYTDSFNEPINSWEDICVPDDSCPNMVTAVCMWADTFNQLVEEGRVSFKVHEFEFFPKLLFVISQVLLLQVLSSIKTVFQRTNLKLANSFPMKDSILRIYPCLKK